MENIYSTAQLAAILGCETWHVRRLFEDGTLDEPQRFAGKRAIPSSLIPEIVDRLRDRGWIAKSAEAAQ